MRKTLLVLLVPALFLSSGDGRNTPASAGQAGLLDVDRAFAAATATNGLDSFLDYFAEDAIILPEGRPRITGKTAIREHYQAFFGQPGFRIDWSPQQADVAPDGSLGYTVGVYRVTRRGEDGTERTQSGKYLTVWKRQPDGTWKVAVDSGNATTGDAGEAADLEPGEPFVYLI